jgi:hypothetical protein
MYRPACRINQTGVRSVTSPRDARTKISLSPGSRQWLCSMTTSSSVAAVEKNFDGDGVVLLGANDETFDAKNNGRRTRREITSMIQTIYLFKDLLCFCLDAERKNGNLFFPWVALKREMESGGKKSCRSCVCM